MERSLLKSFEWLADKVARGAYKEPSYPEREAYATAKEYSQARLDYLTECSLLECNFRLDLSLVIQAQLDFTPAQAELIVNRAWNEGHSSGYEEIITYARDYSDFAERILFAGGYIDD